MERQVHQLERAASTGHRLTVLVASSQGHLRLRTVRVRIDSHSEQGYEFAQPEWDAIAMGAAYPAWQGQLPAGTHRLRIEIAARAIDADPSDPRVLEWSVQIIDIQGDSAFIITLKQKRFGRAGLELTPVEETQASTLAAQFWLWSDRPFLAAREVARAASDRVASSRPMLTQLGQQSRQWFNGDGLAAADENLVSRARDYDDAVRALSSGHTDALQGVAELEAESEAQWSIRDQANLILGYHYLRQAKAKDARAHLGAVRSPGPRASEALLGYGWTFLIEPAAVEAATEPSTGQPNFVANAQAAASDADAKRRQEAMSAALVPWIELIGGDPLDVAAQEGALAVAWVLEQMETGAQAFTYYQRAAERLETGRQLLENAMEHVGGGAAAKVFAAGQNYQQSGWRAWLSDLPYQTDTAYMRHLLKEPEFVIALEAFRTAQVLDDALLDCQSRLMELRGGADTGPILARIERLREAHKTRLSESRLEMERLALGELRLMKFRIEQYLAHARFALARQLDSQTETQDLAWLEQDS